MNHHHNAHKKKKNFKKKKRKKKLRVYIKHVQKLLQYIKKEQGDKFNKKTCVLKTIKHQQYK